MSSSSAPLSSSLSTSPPLLPLGGGGGACPSGGSSNPSCCDGSTSNLSVETASTTPFSTTSSLGDNSNYEYENRDVFSPGGDHCYYHDHTIMASPKNNYWFDPPSPQPQPQQQQYGYHHPEDLQWASNMSLMRALAAGPQEPVHTYHNDTTATTSSILYYYSPEQEQQPLPPPIQIGAIPFLVNPCYSQRLPPVMEDDHEDEDDETDEADCDDHHNMTASSSSSFWGCCGSEHDDEERPLFEEEADMDMVKKEDTPSSFLPCQLVKPQALRVVCPTTIVPVIRQEYEYGSSSIFRNNGDDDDDDDDEANAKPMEYWYRSYMEASSLSPLYHHQGCDEEVEMDHLTTTNAGPPRVIR